MIFAPCGAIFVLCGRRAAGDRHGAKIGEQEAGADRHEAKIGEQEAGT